MEFEWDDAKREINLQTHGVDFSRAKLIWRLPCFDPAETRVESGELRYKAIGAAPDDGNLVLAVVYTLRNGTYRIISARAASKRERRDYHNAMG